MNAIIFTRATLMPIAAAARSFERIARTRRPIALRRMLLTTRARTSATTTRKMPKTGRDDLSPRTRPKSQPNSSGFGTFAPPVLASPTNLGFLNTNSVIATPPASVTIARFVPRRRSAGSPVSAPNAVATMVAPIGASGKGTSHAIAIFDSVNPATPANAIWASDVCPAYPVRITNDRAMTTMITVVMIAPRHNGPKNNRPVTAATTGTPTDIGVTRAGGTAGSRHMSTAPRSGSRSPNATIATMMIRNGRPSRAP